MATRKNGFAAPGSSRAELLTRRSHELVAVTLQQPQEQLRPTYVSYTKAYQCAFLCCTHSSRASEPSRRLSSQRFLRPPLKQLRTSHSHNEPIPSKERAVNNCEPHDRSRRARKEKL